MSNSALVQYTKLSPNKNSPRNTAIQKITVHHMAGNLSVETCGTLFAKASYQASANYGIGTDGRVGLYVEEKDRAWTSSSRENDHQAVTVEVANDKVGGDWHVSDKALAKLVDLCADICKRNGIKKLEWTGNKDGNLTIHSFFTQTSCLPVNRTELLTKNGWKLLKNIKIGDEVATAHIDDLRISFSPVLDKVEEYTHDTWQIRDLEATADHRVVWYAQNGTQKITKYADLFDKIASVYLPNAGKYDGGGLDLCDDELEFLIAVQADGHYMRDGNCQYGIEFHLSKERKINRIKELLGSLGIEYTICSQSNGTTKIRVYGKKIYEFCESYLNQKTFTWKFIEMSPSQAAFFMDKLLDYDGCRANRSYSSSQKENIDVVSAVACLNGVGVLLGEDKTRIFFKESNRSLGDCAKKRRQGQTVGCVTVGSGFILIRQDKRTTVVGNCPGPYLKSKMPWLASEVNKRLSPVQAAPLQAAPVNPYKEPAANLKKGSKGEGVQWAQWHLKRKGYDIGGAGIDGDFGAKTDAAVKAAQKAAGLAVDGVVGSKTREWMKK
jgi:N-acetyl-anhydromuramyl-L-alanine amidase AmpD